MGRPSRYSPEVRERAVRLDPSRPSICHGANLASRLDGCPALARRGLSRTAGGVAPRSQG